MEENLEPTGDQVVEKTEEKHLDYKEGATPEDKVKVLEKRMTDKESYYGKEVSKRDREIEEFKSKYDNLVNENASVKEMISELKTQLTPKNVEPEMPADYDITDANVPGTSTYEYIRKKEAYKEQIILQEVEALKKEQQRLKEQTQADKDAEALRKMQEQYRTQVMGMTQKAGATQAESVQIHQVFGTPKGMKDITGEEALRMIRALNKKPDSQPEVKGSKPTPPPPSGISGGQHVDSLTNAERAEARQKNISEETMAHLVRRRKLKKE